MRRKVGWFGAAILLAIWGGAVAAQTVLDTDAVWADFLTWFKTTPWAANPIAGYAAKVRKDGLSAEEASRRVQAIMEMLQTRRDWIEVHFDKTYSRSPSGDPARDGFASRPSEFLEQVIAGLPPGRALDAGMGQGRNAVCLARRGWSVTGFDLSGEAVAAARSNAEAAGVRLTAIQAAYEHFDFGENQWDLIVLAFAWAPVTDTGFVKRLHTALRPGGLVVFEHFVEDASHRYPAPIRAVRPGQLRDLFGEFAIARYEETEGIGDWGGPGSQLVRMAARKE